MQIPRLEAGSVNKYFHLSNIDESPQKQVAPFEEFLKKSIYDLNEAQKNVEVLEKELIAGKLENLHDLTIQAEMASIQLKTFVNVKNKLVEAYKEISRIQI